MKVGQSGHCLDREFAFVLDNLVCTINYNGLFTMVFLDNSKSLLGIAAGLGLARHFRVPFRTRS